MPTLTTNQKIAIAVSVPVAGILLYFLLRWARDDDEFMDDDTVEREEADEFITSSDLLSEVQIQQCHVGAVIGRGGSVIKQIQKESQTRINFKDDDEESGDEVSEEAKERVRTILIRGSRERIKQAEVLIQKVIDELPVLEKAKVEIPQRVIGRIIGRGGKTIRQLCRVSGAKIKIDSDNEMGEVQTCDIVGTETQIECAKQLIEEKISEDKEFRAKKGTQNVDGDFFGVYVSAMDTPGHFWIQNITKDSKQLDDLVEEMTQFYGDRGQGHRLIPPKVGDLCCATFQHDESWYRGEVVEVLKDSSQVRIHYLDFGDTGVVSNSHVKEIRKEFCYLPFQAIECCLANIEPKGEKWSQESCDSFEKLSSCAQWTVLMARVVYYDENGVPCIELFDTNGEQDVNIEKKLEEQGYAVYKEKMSPAERKDKNKVSNSPSQSSRVAVEQIIAEQKEISLKKMNEQFRSPGFEDVSFDVDRSESFEFSSPVSTTPHAATPVHDKGVVNEASITPAEQEVVSSVDISQLESLFGMLNVNPDSLTDGVDLGKSETDGTSSPNLPGETELDEKETENTLLKAQDSVLTGNVTNESKAEGETSENLIQEHRLVTEESFRNSENDSIQYAEPHDNSEKDDTPSNQVPKSLDTNETVSENLITSSVADNAHESIGEKASRENMAITGLSVATDDSPDEIPLLRPDPATELLKNNDNQTPEFTDELSMNKDDQPIMSTSDDRPDQYSDTAVKSTLTDSDTQEKQGNGGLDNGSDRVEHVLRRSCSEDLTIDDTRTNGSLTKSSSEIAVSPSEDKNINKETSKTQLSSRSLSSLPSLPKGGKRMLAANFSQMLNSNKHESDMDDEEDDDDSIYLSAKEDSDSTGYVSAIGSRTNLKVDADSDATPSGYLSEPEGSSTETGETHSNLEDQARLDTTLLVEKLDQYADK